MGFKKSCMGELELEKLEDCVTIFPSIVFGEGEVVIHTVQKHILPKNQGMKIK